MKGHAVAGVPVLRGHAGAVVIPELGRIGAAVVACLTWWPGKETAVGAGALG